jgi:hypothetical protein
MKAELNGLSNGIWSPLAQMKWYRKQCNKRHKKYQASKLKEKLEVKEEYPSSILRAPKSTVTKFETVTKQPQTNLRLY